MKKTFGLILISVSTSVSILTLGITAFADEHQKVQPKFQIPAADQVDQGDRDFQGSKWEEIQNIIDDIKIQNPSDKLKLKVRLGQIQTITNNQGDLDGVQFGQGGSTVGFGLDADYNLFNSIGIEARETYTQNFIPTVGSANGTNAYISWFDGGPTYTFYLDSTHLDNTLLVKLLYHENYNNIALNPSSPTFLWVNYYSGFSMSIERDIPITDKLGIMGMFDLLQIINTSSPSLNTDQGVTPTHNTIAKSGYGFEIHAEIYYKINWKKLPLRLGVMYWQQGNQSELDDSIKNQQTRNSYFQTSRALFATTCFLF